MRKIIFLALLLINCQYLFAQNLGFRYSQELRFLNKNNDTLLNPFVGGLIAPMFNSIDLDLDGKKDLLVFDRSGHRTLTFINVGATGQSKYRYAPEYQKLIPKLVGWVLLVDYNRDGKEDIFTPTIDSLGRRRNEEITVYRNTSLSKLSFALLTDSLKEAEPKKPMPNDPNDTAAYKLTVGVTDMPCITDIDLDGDIDILTVNGSGTVMFTKNYQVEKALPADSSHLRRCDGLWGSISITTTVHLGQSFGYKAYMKANAHNGLTLTALDLDGDGDKEMLVGDAARNKLYMLHNSKTELNWKYNGFPSDTITRFDTIFPVVNGVDFPVQPAAYYLDVNNDGKKDLLVAPFPITGVKTQNQVWYYENTGSATIPVFTLRQKNFLQETMVDAGSYFAPALLDYDQDGDHDLLVGTHGDFEESKDARDRLLIFENMKNNAEPVFKLADSNYLDITSLDRTFIRPATGDLNRDGKTDIILGSADGRLLYFENNSNGSGMISFKPVEGFFAGIDVGNNSAPSIFDLNFDGKPDLLIASDNGQILYYRNRGNQKKSYLFKASPDIDSLGKIEINNNSLFAASFFDYKNDSMVEMLLGNMSGNVSSYRVTADLASSFPKIDSCLMLAGDSTYSRTSLGSNSRCAPLVADMDNDQVPDLLLGMHYGGLHYFKGYDRGNLPALLGRDTVIPTDTTSGGGGTFTSPQTLTQYHLYPNPSSQSVTLHRNGNLSPQQVHIYNLNGQLLDSQKIPAGLSDYTIDISQLPTQTLLFRFYEEKSYIATWQIIHTPY